MRKVSQWSLACGLIGFGYLLGVSGVPGLTLAWAQNEPAAAAQPSAVSEETQMKIAAAFAALQTAREGLEQETLYTPATKSLNVFGVLSGGLDAVSDLESGRGVDPETFAALYAGQASDEISQKLGRDTENRLTYNGKLIQMYPISRLARLYAARTALSGEQQPAAGADGEKPAEEAPATEEN